MSRLSELLTDLCPDGVEFKRLGDVGSMYGGLTGKDKNDFGAGDGQYIPYVNVFANRTTDLAATEIVAVGPGERQNRVRKGDVLFTGSSENLSEVGMSSVVTEEPNRDVYLNSFCFGFRLHDEACLMPGFAAHLFRSYGLRQQIVRTANGVTRFNVSKAAFRRVSIPVPPLAAQRAIAETLDSFEQLETELEAELQAELEARSQQHAHYRNTLLTFDRHGETEWSTLGEISVKVTSGATPTAGRPAYYDSGTIPWLRTSEVRFVDIYDTEMRITEAALDETAVKWIPANCVIVAISGATAGRSAVNKIPLTTNQHCCNLQIDPARADYRYVFHWVARHYEAIKALGRGARGDLNGGIIKGYEIPLPSLQEQRRIAGILDKFDVVVSDFSSCLPVEIAARRKQYEYYRDKLLTFRKKIA